tara:strand:- start:13191 stop:13757 length:567 start_codon:yes stop_codon:yes gene_type:complete
VPAAIIGIVVAPNCLKYLGFLTGQNGVDYYAEIHTSPLNCIIHTIGMPFVAYGSLLIIPSISRAAASHYVTIQRCIYVAYMGHYFTIDPRIGAFTAVVYAIPTAMAVIKTKNVFEEMCSNDTIKPMQVIKYDFARLNCACYGLLIMMSALTLQESLGHTLGGDKQSRPEGILNALIYAIYFSISHLVG